MQTNVARCGSTLTVDRRLYAADGESSLLVLHAWVGLLRLSAPSNLCGHQEEGEELDAHSQTRFLTSFLAAQNIFPLDEGMREGIAVFTSAGSYFTVDGSHFRFDQNFPFARG